MKSTFSFILIFTFAIMFAHSSLRAANTSIIGKPFPTIETNTLDGSPIKLPDDSNRDATIIMLAFEQKTQFKIDSWADTLFNRYDINTNLGYYEIPMISGFYSFMSGVIDGGMRGKITSTLHDNVATFYGDREPYKKALNITDMSECYLYVVDRNGKIVHYETGYSDFQKLNRLFAVIDELLENK